MSLIRQSGYTTKVGSQKGDSAEEKMNVLRELMYMVRPHLDPYNKKIELKNERCFNLRKQHQEQH